MTAPGPSATDRPGQGLWGCYRPQMASAGQRWLRPIRQAHVALVFSDVSRVLPAAGDDFADGEALGNPSSHLGFSMAVEMCRRSALAACPGHNHGSNSKSVRCHDSARSRTAYTQEMLRTAMASPSADIARRAGFQVSPRVHRQCFSAREGTVCNSPVRKNFTRTRYREVP